MVVVSCAGLLWVSCSTTPPEILQTFWQVNLVHSTVDKTTHEQLSFFVHVNDSEGISDIGSIYLLNDKSELYWRLDPSNWEYSDRNGELWVGTNFIRMSDGSRLPRGSYRVLVDNLAGERATGDIFVSANRLNPSKSGFPDATIAGGRVRVASTLSQTTLWLYGLNGELAVARQVGSTPLPLSSLLPGGMRSRSTLTMYVYGYDKSCGCGLINGPYSLEAR